MSLRWRLIGGLVLLLSALWASAAVWFFFDVRSELQEVLDARLASSARMVQGLVDRGDLRLPSAADAGSASARTLEIDALPSDLTCQLWTLGGRLITAAKEAPVFLQNDVPDGFSNRLVAGESFRIYALSDSETDIRIITSEPRSLRKSLVRDMAMAVSAPFILVLPAMVLLIWVAVRRGLVPLERLRRSILSRDATTLDAIPPAGVPPEVAPLVHALNDLFARLAEAFERERRFTGDAAHELRTPLAGVKAQLQIASATGAEIQERALAQAETGLDGMSHLVNQMLLLARLEGEPEGRQEPETCPASEVIRNVLHELQPLAATHQVRLELNDELESDVVNVPMSMLHTALRNLLENAIKYSLVNHSVRLSARHASTHLELRIIDTGPGVPSDQLKLMTRRFYRLSLDQAGTGLGLSIVAAIAHRHGLRLHLENGHEGIGLIAGLDIPYYKLG